MRGWLGGLKNSAVGMSMWCRAKRKSMMVLVSVVIAAVGEWSSGV